MLPGFHDPVNAEKKILVSMYVKVQSGTASVNGSVCFLSFCWMWLTNNILRAGLSHVLCLSDATGYDTSVMMWTSLQELHENDSRSLLQRSVVMHTAHSSFPQGVCIGLSTIQLHILLIKSERETVIDGKKRVRERGLPAFIDGGDLRKMLFATD